jgi:hypothetical protein
MSRLQGLTSMSPRHAMLQMARITPQALSFPNQVHFKQVHAVFRAVSDIETIFSRMTLITAIGDQKVGKGRVLNLLLGCNDKFESGSESNTRNFAACWERDLQWRWIVVIDVPAHSDAMQWNRYLVESTMSSAHKVIHVLDVSKATTTENVGRVLGGDHEGCDVVVVVNMVDKLFADIVQDRQVNQTQRQQFKLLKDRAPKVLPHKQRDMCDAFQCRLHTILEEVRAMLTPANLNESNVVFATANPSRPLPIDAIHPLDHWFVQPLPQHSGAATTTDGDAVVFCYSQTSFDHPRATEEVEKVPHVVPMPLAACYNNPVRILLPHGLQVYLRTQLCASHSFPPALAPDEFFSMYGINEEVADALCLNEPTD